MSDRLFTNMSVYLSTEEKNLLRDHAKKMGLPMARLAAIAIDNEFDQSEPFHYPVSLPTSVFVEGAYVDEGGKILRYLGKMNEGASRDQLMLSRRTIGVPTRETFMLGYRELLMSGLIEEVAPKPKGDHYKYQYPEGYKITVIAQTEKKAYQIREKENEIARMQKEIAKLKG